MTAGNLYIQDMSNISTTSNKLFNCILQTGQTPTCLDCARIVSSDSDTRSLISTPVAQVEHLDFPGGSSSSLPVQDSGQQTVSMRFTETLLLQRFTIDVKQFIPLPDKRKFNGLDRTYCPYPKELNSDEQGNLQSEDSLEAEEDSNIAFKANAKRSIEMKSVQSVGAVGKRAKVQADTSEVTSNQSIENAAEEVYPSYPWHYLTGLSYRDLTNAYAQSDDQIFIKNLLNIQNSDFLMSSSSSNNSCQIIQSNVIVLYQFVSAGLSRLRYTSLTAACHCYYHLKHLLRPLKQSYTSCLPLSPLLSSDVSAQSCLLTASASGCLYSTCLLMSLLPSPVHPPLILWSACCFLFLVYLLLAVGVIVLSAQGVPSVFLSQCTLRIECTTSPLLTMVMSSICILGNICGLSR
ncbi:hypothetical protein MIR68_005483 [Amoeboaphelidium protococcarum]|nr:hypothetical protein MIR68_005483 [Amoeboaphelidium protococcarum]